MAFKQMKRLIAELPMLTAPKEKEELIMYLVVAKEAISAVLMTERDGKQMPIYFVSRALQGLKVNYTPMFSATNNKAEYEALIAGLRIAEQIGVRNLQANVDSRLVANQVNGIYVAKDPRMVKYLEKQKLTPITSPWPLYKWGIVRAGPFPKGPGKVKFLIVAINYFTKWMEAKPVATITGAQAHRTMIKSSNGETPFSLTYGTEVVILVEISMPTMRTAEVDMIKNDEALEVNLDLLEEKREQSAIQEAKTKAKMEKYYNVRVCSTSFHPGDLVYQRNKASRVEDVGKLGAKWEGPYEVMELLGKGAYNLRDHNGNILPRTWNICNLKKCYVHEM
ncbi:reverse transcriptase domain-containing protein [Tanacetum coccineum]